MSQLMIIVSLGYGLSGTDENLTQTIVGKKYFGLQQINCQDIRVYYVC